ncbi:MAG: hypothetical protein AAB295_09615, partial [Chloroflexota bacterium]
RIRAICEKYGVPYVQEGVFKRAKRLLDIMVGKTTMKRVDGFTRLVADAATGTVRVQVTGGDDELVAAAAALLAAARVCGGSARVERRPERLRARVAAWGDGDLPGLFLMKRLKERFDPHGVLAPARGPVR